MCMEAFETMRVLAFSRASRNFNCGTHILVWWLHGTATGNGVDWRFNSIIVALLFLFFALYQSYENICHNHYSRSPFGCNSVWCYSKVCLHIFKVFFTYQLVLNHTTTLFRLNLGFQSRNSRKIQLRGSLDTHTPANTWRKSTLVLPDRCNLSISLSRLKRMVQPSMEYHFRITWMRRWDTLKISIYFAVHCDVSDSRGNTRSIGFNC